MFINQRVLTKYIEVERKKKTKITQGKNKKQSEGNIAKDVRNLFKTKKKIKQSKTEQSEKSKTFLS